MHRGNVEKKRGNMKKHIEEKAKLKGKTMHVTMESAIRGQTP